MAWQLCRNQGSAQSWSHHFSLICTGRVGSVSISNDGVWETLTVAPAEAGVQVRARLRRSMDSGLRRNDERVAYILP